MISISLACHSTLSFDFPALAIDLSRAGALGGGAITSAGVSALRIGGEGGSGGESPLGRVGGEEGGWSLSRDRIYSKSRHGREGFPCIWMWRYSEGE